MTQALALPTSSELEALSPGDRWDLEEALDNAQGVLREFNDGELRHWVEVEGKTQREIAAMVGRSKRAIAKRAERLGLQPHDSRGGTRLGTRTQNGSEPEVIDAEVVEDSPHEQPIQYLNDHYPHAEEGPALRAQVVRWYGLGRQIAQELAGDKSVSAYSREDQTALRKEADEMVRFARLIKKRVKK